VSNTITPELLLTVSCPSIRAVEDAGPMTLTITTWSDGNSRFQWLVEDTVVGSIDLCINAFFNILQTLPQWFDRIGMPTVYGGCGVPNRLLCLHLEDYPEIGFGILSTDESQPLALVVLERGAAITLLDDIGHKLATLDDAVGCGDNMEDNEDGLTDEQWTVEDALVKADAATDPGVGADDDPFAGMDISTKH
jgi:hypothetical protein